MFDKIIGLVTLPIDIAADVVTLGGTLTETKSATKSKLKYLSGYEEFKREQDRKDAEIAAKIIKELKDGR